MSLSDRLIYAFVSVVLVMMVGMLVGSWRMILYSYVLIVGIGVMYGFTGAVRSRRSVVVVPLGITAVLAILFVGLDLLTAGSPTGGDGYVLGLTPSIAYYFFLIAPFAVLVSVIYALTFEADPSPDVNPAERAGEGVER